MEHQLWVHQNTYPANSKGLCLLGRLYIYRNVAPAEDPALQCNNTLTLTRIKDTKLVPERFKTNTQDTGV